MQPKNDAAVAGIKRQVAKLGYLALTKEEFNNQIANYYIYQTGIGTNILLMTIIAFIVGLSISGQTFYTFILENLEKFGALKAIGAKGRELIYMILFRAFFTALIGYGLGIGLVTLMITIAKSRLPNYAATITFENLGMAFGMVLLIAGISSYIGIRKVLKIEPLSSAANHENHHSPAIGNRQSAIGNHGDAAGGARSVHRLQFRAELCQASRDHPGWCSKNCPPPNSRRRTAGKQPRHRTPCFVAGGGAVS